MSILQYCDTEMYPAEVELSLIHVVFIENCDTVMGTDHP